VIFGRSEGFFEAALRHRARMGKASIILLLVACGSSSFTPDAETTRIDAATRIDATIVDAATRVDAGSPVDGGSPLDAGMPVDGGPFDETTNGDALYEAYRAAACEQARRCESRSPSTWICHPRFKSHVWDAALAAWRAGRAAIDPVRARECLEAARAADCSAHIPRIGADPPPGACFLAFRALGGEGSPCSEHLSFWSPECMVGLGCVTEGACPGRCERRPGPGEPCDDVRWCAAGSFCHEGSCRERPRVGDACSGDVCFVGPCIDGRCSLGRELGEACDDDCRLPFRCSAEGFCEEWYGTEEGDPCTLEDECRYPLVCVQQATPAEPGYERLCRRGVAVGASCDALVPCAPGARCERRVCREIVAPDEACDAARVCPLGFRCESGSCVPLPAAGESCDDRCLFGGCRDRVCRDFYPAAGEPCAATAFQCAAGLHCADEGGDFVCAVRCP
jgi:hypothetical protein